MKPPTKFELMRRNREMWPVPPASSPFGHWLRGSEPLTEETVKRAILAVYQEHWDPFEIDGVTYQSQPETVACHGCAFSIGLGGCGELGQRVRAQQDDACVKHRLIYVKAA